MSCEAFFDEKQSGKPQQVIVHSYFAPVNDFKPNLVFNFTNGTDGTHVNLTESAIQPMDIFVNRSRSNYQNFEINFSD